MSNGEMAVPRKDEANAATMAEGTVTNLPPDHAHFRAVIWAHAKMTEKYGPLYDRDGRPTGLVWPPLEIIERTARELQEESPHARDPEVA